MIKFNSRRKKTLRLIPVCFVNLEGFFFEIKRISSNENVHALHENTKIKVNLNRWNANATTWSKQSLKKNVNNKKKRKNKLPYQMGRMRHEYKMFEAVSKR